MAYRAKTTSTGSYHDNWPPNTEYPKSPKKITIIKIFLFFREIFYEVIINSTTKFLLQALMCCAELNWEQKKKILSADIWLNGYFHPRRKGIYHFCLWRTHVRQKKVLSKQLYCVSLSSLIYTHYSIFQICLPLSLCHPNNERFLPNLHVLVRFK